MDADGKPFFPRATMEVSALKHAGAAGLHGTSPLLRLQSDERLITLIRRGNHSAFEALVKRYQARLLAFCRHMLGSREDAEDVLQEVFAAAFNAILADDRAINVRPWLYRIARNRSLNHLRRVQAIGVDSMDVHFSEAGLSTADKVHRREDFRMLISDVQHLAETQRTALLLREIDALSYEQIAEAMDTTVPSVKSLLVRARVSLAEAAEARRLSCDDVRMELGEVAEGLKRVSPPVRRHVKLCEPCAGFRQQLRATNKALAAVFPIGPLLLLKKLFFAHLGTTTAAGGGAAAGTTAAGAGASGLISAGASTLATKTVATVAAAAIVTAGAVEVRQAAVHAPSDRRVVAVAPPARSAPSVRALPAPRSGPRPQARTAPPVEPAKDPKATDAPVKKPAKAKEPATPTAGAPEKPAQPPPSPTPPAAAAPAPQSESGTAVLPGGDDVTTVPAETMQGTGPAPVAPPAGEGSPPPPSPPPPSAQLTPPPAQSPPPPASSPSPSEPAAPVTPALPLP